MDNWDLPLEILPANFQEGDRTTIILKKIEKQFDLVKVEERLRETLPLRAENFSVYLNGRRITPRISLGHKIPFLEAGDYGTLYGEIVIVSSSAAEIPKAGIDIRVKGVLVKKDFFGLERLIKDIARIRGEVNADFLLLTTDRSEIIKDNPQYEEFIKLMNTVTGRMQTVFNDVFEFKESRKAKRVLAEVLDKIKKALILNPQICPEGLVPLGDENITGTGEPGYIQGKNLSGQKETTPIELQVKKITRKKGPGVRRLSPTAVVRRLKVGEKGINCCIDHFGESGPESFCEGTIVYVNRDHPLFKDCSKDRAVFSFSLTRLLTQEIALMKTRSAKDAFQIQSKLLQDTLEKGLPGRKKI